MKKPTLIGHGALHFTKEGAVECCMHPLSEHCSLTGQGGGETVYESRDAGEKVSNGVASDAYRAGWERIWGEKPAN